MNIISYWKFKYSYKSKYDLSITISSNKNINNIYGKITLFGYYKDLSVLLKNNSHISIDQPNIFHDTNRKFKGNVTITKVF